MIKKDLYKFQDGKYDHLDNTVKKKFTNFENFKIKKKEIYEKEKILENYSQLYSIILNNKSLLFTIKFIFKNFHNFFSLLKPQKSLKTSLKSIILENLKNELKKKKSKLQKLTKYIIDKQKLKILEFLYSLKIPLFLEKIKTPSETSEILHYLTKYKKNKILNFFLTKKKKNINIKNKNLETPIVTAFRYNNKEGLILLIKKNAEIENLYYKDLGIYNALFFSIIRNYLEITELLIFRKIDINFLTQKNDNVLFWAISKLKNRNFCEKKNFRILKKFRKKNEINFQIVKILIENRIDLNVENFFGENCLILAIKYRKKKIFEILLEENKLGFFCVFKAFVFAYKNNFLFEANFIFKKQKEIFFYICEFSKMNFFHFLNCSGNFKICDFLLEKDFFIDKKEKCVFGWDCNDYKQWDCKEDVFSYKIIFSN